MEKFFIVDSECKIYAPYMEWYNTYDLFTAAVRAFFVDNGIETKTYRGSDVSLSIVPTEKDAKVFGNQLLKAKDWGVRTFRKNSTINQRWIQMLQEKNLKVLSQPNPFWYFDLCRGGSYRMFLHNKHLYLAINSREDFVTPKGCREIKGSEYMVAWEAHKEESTAIERKED